MKKWTQVNGYIISRGSYHGTSDDRIDGWYIDPVGSDTFDRRGPGYPTKKAAIEAAKQLPRPQA